MRHQGGGFVHPQDFSFTGMLAPTFPNPNPIGALRAMLPGVTISNTPDVPLGPSIPAVEEVTNSLHSPQDDLDVGVDLVTGEGLRTT